MRAAPSHALRYLCPILLVSSQCLADLTDAQTADLQTFASSTGGYLVKYPETWHQFPPRLPTLFIVNFPPSQRAHAVVLPEGGASIAVTPAPIGVSNAEEWYARDIKPGMHPVSRTNIVLT